MFELVQTQPLQVQCFVSVLESFWICTPIMFLFDFNLFLAPTSILCELVWAAEPADPTTIVFSPGSWARLEP